MVNVCNIQYSDCVVPLLLDMPSLVFWIFIVQHKGKALRTFSPPWIKFGIGDNHIMPLSRYEFHVNQCCISHSSLGGVWEILPLFYVMNQICLKLGTGAVQKKIIECL
jgi:hypothetical protein